MIPSIDPQRTRIDHHQLALQAGEQYQLKQALRDAKAHRRSERNASDRLGRRRYFGLIPGRTSPAPR